MRVVLVGAGFVGLLLTAHLVGGGSTHRTTYPDPVPPIPPSIASFSRERKGGGQVPRDPGRVKYAGPTLRRRFPIRQP